jgi:nucleotide-binding universal stress UspA family protein
MGTIVVGYVSRPESRAALRAAIDEAHLRGSRLVVVSSHRGGASYTREDAEDTEEALQEVEAQLAESGIEHEIRGLVRGQDAPDDILDVADELDAELIVIGLRQRSPVGKLLLGSNAQRILLEARAPVLAVKASESDG